MADGWICQCGHTAAQHERGTGCLADWTWDDEGIAIGPDGCRCEWAHLSSPERGSARV